MWRGVWVWYLMEGEGGKFVCRFPGRMQKKGTVVWSGGGETRLPPEGKKYPAYKLHSKYDPAGCQYEKMGYERRAWEWEYEKLHFRMHYYEQSLEFWTLPWTKIRKVLAELEKRWGEGDYIFILRVGGKRVPLIPDEEDTAGCFFQDHEECAELEVFKT